MLSRTNGGIIYVDVAFALKNHFNFFSVKNKAGVYQLPGTRAIQAAIATVTRVNPDNKISIVDPPKTARAAYPICTFVYVILPTKTANAAALRKFVFWGMTKGTKKFGPALRFVQIPPKVLGASDRTLKRSRARTPDPDRSRDWSGACPMRAARRGLPAPPEPPRRRNRPLAAAKAPIAIPAASTSTTASPPGMRVTCCIDAATRAAPGIVKSQATTMSPATPQRTADNRRVAPAPSTAPDDRVSRGDGKAEMRSHVEDRPRSPSVRRSPGRLEMRDALTERSDDPPTAGVRATADRHAGGDFTHVGM